MREIERINPVIVGMDFAATNNNDYTSIVILKWCLSCETYHIKECIKDLNHD